jgi:AGZA family xanthine/uracil permease-like MFS transporter
MDGPGPLLLISRHPLESNMNQPHHATGQTASPAAGQGLLERLFALKGHGTTARTEVIAGITTFLTMVYIVFVNPQILSAAGMDTQAVFVTTCLIAGIGSILMGLLANLPIALAPPWASTPSSPSWWWPAWATLGKWAWAPSSGVRWAC